MRKNNNIIEINSQRYDAATGAVMSHTGPSQPTAKPATTIHDVVRRPAKQHASHRPAAARTLMRQAVKKPSPSLKRQSRAQGHMDTLAKPPLSQLTIKKSVERLDAERLRHAKQIPKSRLISHFPTFTGGNTGRPAWPTAPVASPAPQLPLPPKQPAPQLKHRPKTTADLLDQAIEQATSHLEPPVNPRRPHRLSLRRLKAVR